MLSINIDENSKWTFFLNFRINLKTIDRIKRKCFIVKLIGCRDQQRKTWKNNWNDQNKWESRTPFIIHIFVFLKEFGFANDSLLMMVELINQFSDDSTDRFLISNSSNTVKELKWPFTSSIFRVHFPHQDSIGHETCFKVSNTSIFDQK